MFGLQHLEVYMSDLGMLCLDVLLYSVDLVPEAVNDVLTVLQDKLLGILM